MDDFDYSLHISERDWGSFFQECEGCNLLQATLAGLDDSGLSDTDEAEGSLSDRDPGAGLERGVLEQPCSTDGRPDLEGVPVAHCHGPGGLQEVVVSAEDCALKLHMNVSQSEGKSQTRKENAKGDTKPDLLLEEGSDFERAAESAGCEPELETFSSGQTDPSTGLFTSEQTWPAKSLTQERNFNDNDLANMAVDSSSTSPPAGNPCGHIGLPSQGPSWSGLTVSEGAERGSTGEEMANQACDPQTEQMTTETPPCGDTPVRVESQKDRVELPRKEKERWFVTVNTGQPQSRGNVCIPVKKKRRKKRHSKDPLEPGCRFEGQNPAIQSKLEAERIRVPKAEILEITWEAKSLQLGNEFTACPDETGHHKYSNEVHFPSSQQEKGSQSENSLHLQERDKINIFAISKTDSVPENFTVDNLFSVKVFQNTIESPEGCLCENLVSSEELCLNKNNKPFKGLRVPELSHEGFPSESTNKHNVQTFSQVESKSDGNLESQQINSLSPRGTLLEVPNTDSILEFRGSTVPDFFNVSEVSGQSKVLVETGRGNTPETPKTQMPEERENQEEKNVNDLHIQFQANSQAPLYVSETNNTVNRPPIHSTLSASEITQPQIVTDDNMSIVFKKAHKGSPIPQVIGQQSIVEEPTNIPAKLGPTNSTISSGRSAEVDLHDSSNTMLGVLAPADCETNKGSPAEDVKRGKLESENTVKIPEIIISDPIKTEMQVLLSKQASTEGTQLAAGHNPAHTVELSTTNNAERESLESRALDETLDSAHPVYAISSFWDEMEKLTINDILHLRLVGCAQPPREQPRSQDSVVTDTSDATDSDYFTHLDDSRPDRSSCEFSAFSDFEEDFLQTLSESTNPSPEPPDKKHGEASKSPISTDLTWESPITLAADDDLDERTMLSSEDSITQGFHSDSGGFGLECKNGKNLQALNEEAHVLKSDSTHTVAKDEGSCLRPYNVEALPTFFLSREVMTVGHTACFPDIVEHLFTEEGVPSDAASSMASSDDENLCNLSVAETYDYFFSEFEPGNFFFPLIQQFSRSKDKIVPIFSCSRSVSRSLRVPEAYEYFCPDDSPVHSEDEGDCEPNRASTLYDNQTRPLDAATALDTSSDWKGNLFWGKLSNCRRLGFTWGRFGRPLEGSVIWALATTHREPLFQTITQASTIDSQDFGPPHPHSYSPNNQIFKVLEEQQTMHAKHHTSVSVLRKDDFLFSFKQSDMCLVCIAFASWVLKSTNPQTSDNWKTALLANVSAISAIRYLRRYIREDAKGDKP